MKLSRNFSSLYGNTFFALLFVIPISQYFSTRLLVALFIFGLINKRWKRLVGDVLDKNWDLILYFAILMLGLLYSDDLFQGFRVIETSFSILALPLLFSYLRFRRDLNEKSIQLFSLGVLVAGILCLGEALIQYLKNGDLTEFVFYKLTDIVSLQPTYLAYYVIFTLTYLFFITYYSPKKLHFVIASLFAFFLIVILTLTGGHTALVSLLLISSFFGLKYLLDKRGGDQTRAIILIAVVLCGLILTTAQGEFDIFFQNKSDYWERYSLWRSAIDANQNVFFGVGTGDYKNILNNYYQSQNMNEFSDYNSHNQFVQLYFSNGMLGLATLLLIIGRPLYLAFKSQNPLGILIMFPFVIYGTMEVFLGRFQGVIFFVFCHQIVIHQFYTAKSSYIINSGANKNDVST